MTRINFVIISLMITLLSMKSFSAAASGITNAVSSTTIALPAGKYSTLNLLATGVNGNQVNQTFVVTYTDGSTTSFTQSLSDWFSPQNYAGESQASKMAYRLTASGATQNGPFYLYGYSFAINSAKTVKSLALPQNRHVVVLSVDLNAGPVNAGTPVSVNLSNVDNVVGIANYGKAVINKGLDASGYAYCASLLGTSVTWAGSTFSLGAAGSSDAASKTTIALPAAHGSTLKLLATAVNGDQRQSVVRRDLYGWNDVELHSKLERLVLAAEFRGRISGVEDGLPGYLLRGNRQWSLLPVRLFICDQ